MCWNCNQRGNFQRDCKFPRKTEPLVTGRNVGKREKGVRCSPGERLDDSKGQPPLGIRVSSGVSHGLYIKGFVEGQSVNCLIDTASVKTILSSKMYDRLPKSQIFSPRNENTDILLADGSSSQTRGTGETMLRIGKQELMVHLVVADIEDDVIVGMDYCLKLGRQ